jgi:hypothetical protein
MDVFNPISPLQIEVDERQGMDAALLEVSPSGALRANLVYAPQNGFRRSSSAVRLSGTIHNIQFRIASRDTLRFVFSADYAFPNSLY